MKIFCLSLLLLLSSCLDKIPWLGADKEEEYAPKSISQLSDEEKVKLFFFALNFIEITIDDGLLLTSFDGLEKAFVEANKYSNNSPIDIKIILTHNAIEDWEGLKVFLKKYQIRNLSFYPKKINKDKFNTQMIKGFLNPKKQYIEKIILPVNDDILLAKNGKVLLNLKPELFERSDSTYPGLEIGTRSDGEILEGMSEENWTKSLEKILKEKTKNYGPDVAKWR